MSDLAILFQRQEETRRWCAEYESAGANLRLARIAERSAYLISQHEPVTTLGLDREKLRAVLSYLKHGDEKRLLREIES